VNISKQSWHYRLQLWLRHDPEDSSNLCDYFWKVVAIIFIFFCALMLLIGAMYSLCFVFWTYCLCLRDFTYGTFWVTVVMGCITYTIIWIKRHKRKSFIPRTFVGEYIKSVKSKICPLIDFV